MDSATPRRSFRPHAAVVALPLGAWLGTVSATAVLSAHTALIGQPPALTVLEALIVLFVVQAISLLATLACLRGAENHDTPTRRDHRLARTAPATAIPRTAAEPPRSGRQARLTPGHRVRSVWRLVRSDPMAASMAVAMHVAPGLLLWPSLTALHAWSGLATGAALFVLGAIGVLIGLDDRIGASPARRQPGIDESGNNGGPPATAGSGKVTTSLARHDEHSGEGDVSERVDGEDEDEFDPRLVQRTERRRTDEHGECVEALLCVDFAPHQSARLVHLPLQPPLEASPEVEAFPLSDGFECRVRRVAPYGASFEVRRLGAATEAATARLAVHLTAAPTCPDSER